MNLRRFEDRIQRRFAVTALAALVVAAGLGCSGTSRSSIGQSVGHAHTAGTFSNDQAAFDYFLGKGLTNFQAAGIVGNLDQESGMDPTIQQQGGQGYGIAQWSEGDRWDTTPGDNCVDFANAEGLDPNSLQAQLDFLWFELPNNGLGDIQASTDVTGATTAFQNDFERCDPNYCDLSNRISYAQAALDAFGNDSPGGGGGGGGGGSPPGGGDACSGFQDGLYCGSDPNGGPSGDPNTLYQCASGVTTNTTQCPAGCQTFSGSQDDACKPGGSPPPPPPGPDACSGFEDGFYCGNDPNGGPTGDPNTLYQCAGGATVNSTACPSGCQTFSGSQDDACK